MWWICDLAVYKELFIYCENWCCLSTCLSCSSTHLSAPQRPNERDAESATESTYLPKGGYIEQGKVEISSSLFLLYLLCMRAVQHLLLQHWQSWSLSVWGVYCRASLPVPALVLAELLVSLSGLFGATSDLNACHLYHSNCPSLGKQYSSPFCKNFTWVRFS